MARPKITLYLDTVSPFAYIAYYVLRHDPVFSKCDIKYIPILLGGVFKATGNIAPIQIKSKSAFPLSPLTIRAVPLKLTRIPDKDTWINQERLRWTTAFKVPIASNLPGSFPPPTLSIMRALCALSEVEREEGQERLIAAFDALYDGFWVQGRPTHEPQILKETLESALGKEATARVMEMVPKEGKALLAKNTDKALEDGAFGLPWFTCTNSRGETQGFWGVDHLGQVCNFLGLEKPAMGGWKSLL